MSGRVDEEVRPHGVAAFALRQLGQVVGQLGLAVPPGEVGVGLGEADLGEALHHLRPGEGLGEEDDVGVLVLHLADHPLPERERLGVRVVDAEDANAVLDPEQDDVAQRVPQRREGVAVEMDVDDVLVLLRRVLGVLDRAVRPPVEPLRMLLDPRMVGGALDGEVDGDLQAVVAGGLDQPGEIVEAAELGMDGVVAAVGRADRIGAARVVRAGGQRVVLALAEGAADRMDRRKIEDVEAEIAHIGQLGDHVVEGAVAVGGHPTSSAGTARTRR